MDTDVNERVCKACASSKELTKENWYPAAKNSPKFRQPCRRCINLSKRQSTMSPEKKAIINERDRKRYAYNREVCVRRSVEYVRNHSEQHKAHRARYYTGNKSRWTAYAATRRAAKSGTRTSYTPEEFKEVLEFFNHRCAYCLLPSDKLVAEHMRPLSKGGDNSIDNIVPSCPRCNGQKHTKTLLEIVNGVERLRILKA